MSRRRFCKTSWKRLEDILARRLGDVFKTSWRRLEDILKTYGQDDYIGLDQDVFKRSWKRLLKTFKLRRIYSFWLRRLEDVFWRRRQRTSSRHLQDVFIKTNICCVILSCFFSFFSIIDLYFFSCCYCINF